MTADQGPMTVQGPAYGFEAVSKAVADDLSTIFPATEPAARSRGRGRRGGAATPRLPFGRSRKASHWGAVAAAALVGLSAGSFAAMAPGLTGRKAEATAAKAPGTLQIALASPVPAASPAPSAPVQGFPYSPEPFTPVNPAGAATSAPPPGAQGEAPQPRAKAKPRPRPQPEREAVSGCRGGCDYAEVMAADRRLRQAYDRAIRAGVDRGTLASVRSRWARLRHRAPHDPERVVHGYAAMARDLTELARDARAARAMASGGRGSRA